MSGIARAVARTAGLLLLGLGVSACLGLSGTGSAGLLTGAQAAATAARIGCYPQGSYPHDRPSPSPTPTGTWTRPPPTAYPTPIRCGDPPCPLPPPRWAPPAWPPPAVTCTAGPDEPPATPWPSPTPAYFPAQPALPALPPVVGAGVPVLLAPGLGAALPGGVAVDARTGQPWLLWTQGNLDRGYEGDVRLYLRTRDPATGTWRPPQAVPVAGLAVGPYGLPLSTLAVGPAGQLAVLVVTNAAAAPHLVLCRSADGGTTWSAPAALPGGGPYLYNLRAAYDPAGGLHVLYLTKPGASSLGRLYYYGQTPAGTWVDDAPPAAQAPIPRYADFTVLTQPDGTLRTVLSWVRTQAVLVSTQDALGRAWTPARLLVDGAGAAPDGIPDYEPGAQLPPRAGNFRLLGFTTAAGTPWVYITYSLYSTGRICYFVSSTGGTSWSGEDALAYFPRWRHPDPAGTVAYGTVHTPAPFWDAASGRVFVSYQYCDATPAQTGCFLAGAYSAPGAPGGAWQGAADFGHAPLPLLRTTRLNAAGLLLGTTGAGPDGAVWLLWSESTQGEGRRKTPPVLYGAALYPATLAGGNPPPGP